MAPKKMSPAKKRPSGTVAKKAKVTRKSPSGNPASPRRLRSGATLLPTAANPLAKKKSPKKKAVSNRSSAASMKVHTGHSNRSSAESTKVHTGHSNRSSASSTKVHTGHSNRSSAVSPSIPRPWSPNYSPQPDDASTIEHADTPFDGYRMLLETVLETIDHDVANGEIEYDEMLQDFVDLVQFAVHFVEQNTE